MLFGEDVAFGGVFRCSVELKDRYGKFIFLGEKKHLLYKNKMKFILQSRNLPIYFYINNYIKY